MSLISFSDIFWLGVCLFWLIVIAQVGWFFAKRNPDEAKTVAKTAVKVVGEVLKKQR